jgi:DNA-binding transcriptional LysR family regulator
MANPDWTLWRSFLAVLQTGSLSQAARRLALTQPTLGRHISLLEEALGAVLFTRSNDGLRPTEAALVLRDQAETMAAAADLLSRIASGEAESLAGRIRLTTSEFIGVAVLPPLLARFRALYPDIDIDLVMSDRNLDLLRGDADLAVRNVAPAQDALLVRKIGEVPVRLFAHEIYAVCRKLPETLAELQDHALIGREEYARRVPAFADLTLRFGFTSMSDVALLSALRAGMGIGACQQGVADADPSLRPVLPDLTIVQLPVWMAMHEDRRRLRRLRLLFDHLAEGLSAYISGQAR